MVKLDDVRWVTQQEMGDKMEGKNDQPATSSMKTVSWLGLMAEEEAYRQ